MLAEGHQQAAEDIEKSILSLQSTPYASRLLIEGAWGAAFHWIAFGCAIKYQRHQESHARLGSFLHSLGEGAVAAWWGSLDQVRQGGWYGKNAGPDSVQVALDLLERVRSWALS